MNKDKSEVGDLVNHFVFPSWGIGLVVKKRRSTVPGKYLYSVYWFLKGIPLLHSKRAIVKCTEETK